MARRCATTIISKTSYRSLQPRFDDESEQNLVHVAAKNGRANFLQLALLKKSDGTEDSEDGKKLGWVSKQKYAFFASVFRDKDGKAPLQHAIDAESGPSIKVLFNCYNRFLSQDYAYQYYPNTSTQQPHPSELFPLDELCVALER